MVGAGKATTFPRSTPALCHSHPHWQRTESHNLGFLRSALQIAHDLIHIVFTHRYCADLSKTVSLLVVVAYSATSSLSRPITKEGRSPKCSVFCSSSVCIGRIRVGMAPRCGGTARLNGTAVLREVRIVPNHCEPSIWRTTARMSSSMADSLLRAGSGITTGSYRATGIERFNASSSSHPALVSFARTLLLRSWPSISLPFWGKEVCGLLHDGSRFARRHSVRVITIRVDESERT